MVGTASVGRGAADGWLTLRFAARHVNGPAVLLERTRRALISRGWHPGA